MIRIYADGGVILSNPSPYGGTWAYIAIRSNNIIEKESDLILARGKSLITNNQMELLAVIRALQSLSYKEVAHVYSDSEVTLGRVFKYYSINNIPDWMSAALRCERERLKNFGMFKYTLLAGHPTKKQLASGVGRNGHPVSKWNVMCDEMCKQEAKEYLESIK